MRKIQSIRLHFFILSVCFVSFALSAQNKKSYIELEAQSSTTTELLKQISKQCQCYFAYPSELVNKNKTHHIADYSGNAESFVRTLFQDSITFEYFKNQVILKEANTERIQQEALADTIFNVSGIIEDKKTKKSIPYASISIQGSMLGTISNADGHFQLKIPANYSDSIVQISCLGYYTHSAIAKDIKKNETIYLNTANISLQEVVVRSVGTNYIMAQAKRTLDHNYRKSSYGYQAFYRELAMNRKQHISYNEALFEGYSPKGSISRDDLILKKARQFSQNEVFDTIQLKLKGGTEAALQLDIANFRPDFLMHGSEQHYHYHINDLQMWHDELIYIVNFRPKEYNDNAQFIGELYISFTDYNLLGASFSYTKQQLKVLEQSLIVRKTSRTRVIPTQYSYRVEYQKLNGKYHINYVKGDISIKAKLKHQLRYMPLNTSFEMTLTQIDTTIVDKPKRTKAYRIRSVFSEEIEFSSEEFWQYDNLIIPEDEIMKAFYKSGFTLDEQQSKKDKKK